MSLLFETIRIENGIFMHPEDHERRMFRSRSALFGAKDPFFLHQVVTIPREFSSGIIRCRVDYGIKIDAVKFTPYRLRPLKKFQVVVNEEIEYPFKFSDRSALESLLMGKNTADEIILVQRGLITDTSFSNLIFYNGRNWITPSTPLLNGTCRQRLIRERKIMERKIFLKGLDSFLGFKIINAMIYPEDMEMIPIEACIRPY
jgi:4-amino-4-deoxychorismate lyase